MHRVRQSTRKEQPPADRVIKPVCIHLCPTNSRQETPPIHTYRLLNNISAPGRFDPIPPLQFLVQQLYNSIEKETATTSSSSPPRFVTLPYFMDLGRLCGASTPPFLDPQSLVLPMMMMTIIIALSSWKIIIAHLPRSEAAQYSIPSSSYSWPLISFQLHPFFHHIIT